MLAFLGGTGAEGTGLSIRLALAGNEIVIGSRDIHKAVESAENVKERTNCANIVGTSNNKAASMGNVVFITVPYEGQKSLLHQVAPFLKGKVVVNTVAPIVIKRSVAQSIEIEQGSAAMETQALLPDSFVVSAFHHVSAVDLLTSHRTIEGDVVVCSDVPYARRRVMDMVQSIPVLRAVNGGGLENSKYVEQMTALLLNINRIYRCNSNIQFNGF